MRTTALVAILILVACRASTPTTVVPAGGKTTPTTPTEPVTDVYHGVSVTESYRWLENADDARVQQWSAAQNAHARSFLDKLPDAPAIRERVTSILSASTVAYFDVDRAKDVLFAMKRQPPKQQPFLVAMPSADQPDQARVLVDPNTIDPSGLTSIDWYRPSPDGKLVAVSLSKGGTESGDVQIFTTSKGDPVGESIPRVNGGTAGGDLAWLPNSSGFFYTRYPRGTERAPKDMNFFQQLYFHALGTPTESDRFELGKDLPRIAEIQVRMDDATGRLLATVQKGDGGEFAHFLRAPNGTWRQFADFPDAIVQAAFGPKDDLYLLSRSGAPKGKILRVAISKLDVAKASVVIPEGKDSIVEDFWGTPTVLPTRSRLYVTYQLGGPSEIRAFDLAGRPLDKPAQLPVAAVGGMVPVGGDDILFFNRSFLAPTTWFQFTAKTESTKPTGLVATSPVNFDDVEVERAFATSKDGTRVPLNILMRKGTKRDGTNPCVVFGYGGYGVNLEPTFRPQLRVLLDRGVIYAVANLRGGSEFGEDWHTGGNLEHKQNVFDDFAAVLRFVVSESYTSREKLAIMGGSNGGLLMGATLTQHPDLMTAVVSLVGIYDMLRVELSPNGAFNVTEFGTVANASQFAALYAYSPYHNAKDGVSYPATLFLTGANDPRVDPMQSRKMTARLQAATSGHAPIFLRTNAKSGHGGDNSLDDQIAELVDIYAFLFDRLGVRSNGSAAAAVGAAEGRSN